MEGQAECRLHSADDPGYFYFRMTQKLNLFDDIPAVMAGYGDIKLITLELNGGLFGHDFSDETMLFSCLEKNLGIEDFAEDRLQAQESLLAQRPDHPWNFDLEKVYAGMRATSEFETTFLRNTFAPRPHARAVLEYALKNAIPVAAACDGPFPEKFWREILAQHGIVTVERIYTTCDLAISKQKYTMFRRVLSDYELEPAQVLHFGPNAYNDLGVPLDIGMRAFLLGDETEALGEKSSVFARVRGALGTIGDVDSHLLLKTMERAVLALPSSGESEREIETAIAGVCVVGPLIVAFSNWILNWLVFHKANRLFLACNEKSPFARIAGIWLRRRMPGLDIVLTPPERIAEIGLQIRDIDVGDAAILSVDSEGTGVGKLIARNPHLAIRPALHYALSGSNRTSAHDHCFIHANGVPLSRFQIAKSTTALAHEVFHGEGTTAQTLIASASRFIIEWAKTESLYRGTRLPRATLMKVLDAAGEAITV